MLFINIKIDMSKRYYTISTVTSELFNEIHTQLIGGQHAGSLINRNVECVDIMEHSPTRGEFLLTDSEAEILKSDSRIKFANLTPARYPEIYNATDDDLIAGTGNVDYNRYGQTVKNWQDWGGGLTDTVADVSRASSQLIRMKQKRNPWISSGTSTTTPISQDPVQKGAGENVDVIVADNGCWIGHVEFINPNRVTFDEGAALSPQDYTGGNVLPGSGYCDVLDLVLDGPYYIDPVASPGSELELSSSELSSSELSSDVVGTSASHNTLAAPPCNLFVSAHSVPVAVVPLVSS